MVELSDRTVDVSPVGPFLLNARDLEVLRCLEQGRSIAEVAAVLSVSRNTVRTRLRRIQGKLSAEGRDDAVRRAREHGIL